MMGWRSEGLLREKELRGIAISLSYLQPASMVPNNECYCCRCYFLRLLVIEMLPS